MHNIPGYVWSDSFVLKSFAALEISVAYIFCWFTPPFPCDEGMAQTAIQVHAINLIKLGYGKSGSPFRISRECKLPTGSPTTNNSPVALQLRAPPKVSARAPAHRSYHFRGVKLKSCIKKIHHNLYISKQANVRIKHADTEGASHKKFGTDARV